VSAVQSVFCVVSVVSTMQKWVMVMESASHSADSRAEVLSRMVGSASVEASQPATAVAATWALSEEPFSLH